MKKVYIAGHKGLVGSAIDRVLTKNGYNNILRKTHSELDLRNREEVFNFFEQERPQWVFLSAAKVGGIYANNTYPVDFLLYNLQIQNNIIEASHKYNVEKLMFLGSSCIYPKECPQPIKEEYLLSGYLESTNRPYALAKIAGIELCDAYNRQYNTDYIAVMPCNLYGINDNYHPENAHVIPMLIRRFHEAKINNLKETTIWGSGTPLREFMFSDDLAEACLYLMENKSHKDIGKFINIGSGKEVTIKELAELIKKVIGFEGNIILDSSKPDGTMRKLLDVSKINSLGWKYRIELEEGLKIAYNDFLKNYNQ
ncbi:GDP-L-fucose synthase [Brachyspira hyodysenteriae]|uniref:GDP-L-fucose synthase n=1 Tax=Brachyspira hyodysenteriae (strain ATCC 49526 / WA1) TaxID=565034 RepID=A0A3B6V7Z3_BRAHW|nr:GDP-L-fucose synthase [Brachyspira hyodysenteriae]ACN82647.1 GDP-fucose synthetase [Brachyspira hyodysenteriae WA1]AUJ50971.1 GDP-fucose synthetase [Brachyspira hyodysenteriae]KLI38101.1 GDP-L-fucose synthase [Brachyspira hyodysenteriae]KLI42081.1 GDP-L-fucose synthase [Brachyspira hyodysenteriae]KLI46528.1 GDP-L-fucose synthase [Brachyspira hyodysenteriae]